MEKFMPMLTEHPVLACVAALCILAVLYSVVQALLDRSHSTGVTSDPWIFSSEGIRERLRAFDAFLQTTDYEHDIDMLFSALPEEKPEEFAPSTIYCIGLLIELSELADQGDIQAQRTLLELMQLCAQVNRYRLAKMGLLRPEHYEFFEQYPGESDAQPADFLRIIVNEVVKIGDQNLELQIALDEKLPGDPFFYVKCKTVVGSANQASPLVYGPQKLQTWRSIAEALPAYQEA